MQLRSGVAMAVAYATAAAPIQTLAREFSYDSGMVINIKKEKEKKTLGVISLPGKHLKPQTKSMIIQRTSLSGVFF